MIEVPEKEECEACEGVGTFDHYNESYNCKSCDKTGKIRTGETIKIKDPKHIFRCGILSLENKYIDNLIKVIDIIDCKTLFIRNNSSSHILMLELNENILIGICRKSLIDENEKDYTIIELK